MPHPSSLQDKRGQNGHDIRHTSLPDLTPADLHASNCPQPAQLQPSDVVNDDWSSITKELVDTTPQIWTRGLLYFLIVFVAIALPWVLLAKVDETGSARGRIEPKGKTLKLDTPVSGTVATVKVKEGQTVQAGQTLFELKSEVSRTELQQAQARLEGQLNRMAQLSAVQSQLKVAVRAQQLQSQAQEAEQIALLNQTQQQLGQNQRVYALEKDRLKLSQNNVQRHRQLQQEGIVSKSRLEEAESAMLERQQMLGQAQSEIQETTVELEKQRSAYERVRQTGELAVLESQRQLKEMQSQIADMRSEIVQTRKQIQSLEFQLRQRIIRTPIDGTIFQLSLDNAGVVLQAGQRVTQIAPKGMTPTFSAQMPSQESGFLRVGMPVKLKFDAYPFQDYGVVSGRLRKISPDSKVTKTAEGNAEVFELDIALDKSYIQTPNKRIALTPGQTGTAEVIVRQRRIIDFILDPFKKLQAGGLEL